MRGPRSRCAPNELKRAARADLERDADGELPLRPGSVDITAATVDRLAGLTAVNGDLRIWRLDGPEVLLAPDLRSVGGHVRVVGCRRVRRIEWNVLETVGGRLELERLPDLEELALPALTAALDVTVDRTDWLCAIDMPNLVQVEADVSICHNGLLGQVGLPRLRSARRVRLRHNAVLTAEAIDRLQSDLRQRRPDAVVDAGGNGETDFERAVRRRLMGFWSAPAVPTAGAFERFLRVAPEVIEVHERMLLDADIDGDRPATLERYRRLLELAQSQGDPREAEFDAAVRYLVGLEFPPAAVERWAERIAAAAALGPLDADGMKLWQAELSALWERAAIVDAPGFMARWRARGTRLVAPFLASFGLHAIAARVATLPPDRRASFWLWETVQVLRHQRWRPDRLNAVTLAATALGRLLCASTVEASGRSFVQLADATTPSPPLAAARAAAAWLAEDVASADRTIPDGAG